MRRLLFLAPLLLGNADPAEIPAAIPAAIRAMLDAALASGDEGEVATIVKYARAADPASGDAVARIAEAWRGGRQRERETRIRHAGALDLWSGRA